MSKHEAVQTTGTKVVRSYYIQLAIVFPFVWFLALSFQALREGNASIYLDMGWIAIPMALLMATEAYIRFAEIDFDSKTVLLQDGIGNRTVINQGTLLKVSSWHGAYRLTFLENSAERTICWQLIPYTSKNRNRILNALFAFSPSAINV